MRMQYDEALSHYTLVADAEARIMPRNWSGRLKTLVPLMKCLALAGQGDTPRFRETERDVRRIQMVNYGTVRGLGLGGGQTSIS
jgi:hypothetical protein